MEHKLYSSELKESNKKDLTVIHFISTERPDRGGDILYADGMVMLGRPVVLLQHGSSNIGMEPIAKPVWIKKGIFKDQKGIEAKTQFFPDELGQKLWEKTTKGYLPNWSVGWRPLRHEYKTDETGKEIRHVYEWELLEYSLVAVPMQPDAQTMTDKAAMTQLAFKIMPPAREIDLGPSYMSQGKLSIWIDDNIINKTIRQTVRKELNRLRGRVE